MNVAAQEVAQSVPGTFPELPIGSPERTDLFREFRRTFVEDWKAAEEAVAHGRREKGDLYFIRAGKAVKIGHTRNIVQRLHNMRANNHEELDCLLLLRGKGHEEAAWHKRFKADRIRGEWFKWSPAIEAEIAKLQMMSPSYTNRE